MATKRIASIISMLSLSLLSGRTAGQEESLPAATASAFVEKFDAREFKSAKGEVLRYRLLKPLDDDANEGSAKQKYPLLIFLHGGGERGDDNSRQLVHGGRIMADETFRRRYPAFIIAPQCPEDITWTSVILGSTYDSRPSPLDLTLQAAAALQKEFSIDANRVYGVGVSMGGDGVLEVLRYKPKLLAAAVIICGYGSPNFAAAFAATPIWLFHGDADGINPVEGARNMVQALSAAGGRPIYTEYAGVGHDAWTPTFDNRIMWDWLFAQRRKLETLSEPSQRPASVDLPVAAPGAGFRSTTALLLGVAALGAGAFAIGRLVRREK
jgi:predicted peptidase